MEEEWVRDRTLLRDLLEKIPHASPQELAQAVGRSVSWVKKWRKRLAESVSHDPYLLCSRSRAHLAPYFRWNIRVIQKIVEMHFAPPENLKRVPGGGFCSTTFPVTKALQAAQVPLPRSSRTIWKILPATGCLVPRSKEPAHPKELRQPLEEIQMDFKDVGSVSSEQSSQGKRQQVVEVCNFVDTGTSIALSAQAREDFHKQTALEAVIVFLRQYGRPWQITFDRDPRWVGGCQAGIFPPHSGGSSCVRLSRRACGNAPPPVAFTTLPALPALPERVNPDACLTSLDQKMHLRHVGRDGCVNVDLTTYYV